MTEAEAHYEAVQVLQKYVADLEYQVERLTLRATGAEQQASRAIARLANVVETVRARADATQKADSSTGMYRLAVAALREMATELQKMELP